MIRFVVIASLLRGAIEPAEVLDDWNQEIAISRLEAGHAIDAKVVWHGDVPYVANGRSPESSRLPRISEGLRRSLVGSELEMNSNDAGYRRRKGTAKRVL